MSPGTNATFRADVNFEILVVLGLTLLNGFFSMSEMAIVSARKARLEAMAEAGDRGARKAAELAQEPSRFLSSVQIGITLVGIVSVRSARRRWGRSWEMPYPIFR